MTARIATRIQTADRGATAVEYGLLVALIAIVMAVGAALFGTALRDLFSSVAGQL